MTSDSPNSNCPKRMWVLSMLSDDEALERLDALPMGLEFHLKQCSSCRTLAVQLRAVGAEVKNLTAAEAPPNLAQRATAQALQALQSGAQPTGRVELVDDPLDTETSRAYRVWAAALAAAAVVIFAVGAVLFLGTPDVSGPPTTGGTLVDGGVAKPEFLPEELDPAKPEVEPVPYTVADAQPATASTRYPSVHAPGSFSEAMELDTEHSFQRATILRRPSEPGPAWRLLFDKPDPAQSTRMPADER